MSCPSAISALARAAIANVIDSGMDAARRLGWSFMPGLGARRNPGRKLKLAVFGGRAPEPTGSRGPPPRARAESAPTPIVPSQHREIECQPCDGAPPATQRPSDPATQRGRHSPCDAHAEMAREPSRTDGSARALTTNGGQVGEGRTPYLARPRSGPRPALPLDGGQRLRSAARTRPSPSRAASSPHENPQVRPHRRHRARDRPDPARDVRRGVHLQPVRGPRARHARPRAPRHRTCSCARRTSPRTSSRFPSRSSGRR